MASSFARIAHARVVNFLGLLLTALVTGVFWGTWFTLTRSLDEFPAPEFLHIGKTIIANVAWPMRFLLPGAILLILWSLVMHPARRSHAFRLLVLALLLMVITLLITLLVEVPIDNMIRAWTVETIPAEWVEHRSTWKSFHALRTLTSVLSFAAYCWSVITWPRALSQEHAV